MLSLFRSNQFTIIPLVLYLVLLHLGALLGHVQAPEASPEGSFLYQSWFGWLASNPFYSALGATLLVFVQALAVNIVADEFRLMGERNWLPALFYVLAASALPAFLFVSAPLVAATFIPLSLRKIFRAYQKPGMTLEIFDAALWIAVASLFYPPALLLLIAGFAGIGVVRSFRIKERFVYLTGAVVALFLGWLWYFWRNEGSAFRKTQWGSLIQMHRFDLNFDEKTMLILGLLTFLTVIFLLGIPTFYRQKSIQAQKFSSVLYWFLVVGATAGFFRATWHWEYLLLPAAAIGIFLALTFQSFRNRMIAEMLHLALLGYVIFVQFSDFLLQMAYK